MYQPLHKSEVETPALMLDLDKLRRNIEQMAAFFRGRPANVRPHAKTHKTPQIARMQMEAGAVGVTCAKLGEAEVMVQGGLKHILIANQVVGASKARRLALLNKEAEVIAAVDSLANVKQLSEAAGSVRGEIPLIVEVDVGMGRSGSRSVAESLALARAIAGAPGLWFRGVMCYEGHAVLLDDREERQAAARKANGILVEHAEALRAAGIPVEIVSAGGTGTYNMTGTFPGITEVQAGSYATFDARYKAVVGDFENALTVLTTVVSRPAADRAILDAGMKAMTKEFGNPLPVGTGMELAKLSEEHGTLILGPGAPDLQVGDRLEVIPSHGCTTINLHDRFYVCQGDLVVDVWPVLARGKLE